MMKPLTIIFACLLCTAITSAQALSVKERLPDESFLNTFDQNRDGKLTLREFLAIKKASDSALTWDFPINRDSFRKLDRNKNGYLDNKDELPIGFTPESIEDFNSYVNCWPRPAPCN